jgi:hypothetical protein
MRDTFERKDAHGMNIGIGVPAGIGALFEPVRVRVVFRCVENIQKIP